jgi:DNA polymerase-1
MGKGGHRPSLVAGDLVGTNLLGSGNLGRDNAKTTMYAFVYGAGNEKLGSIVLPHRASTRNVRWALK